MTPDTPTVILSGPAMVPLVRAAAALESSELPPFAVIGGVAVAVRLGRMVRATAEAVRIRAESVAEIAEAEVPVATTGALIAMKLHAYVDRRGQAGPDKRSGDLWDIYNLLLLRTVDAARDLTAASPLLRDALCTTLRHELVDRAARARTVLRTSRDERYQAITADELAHVATDLVNRLRP